jgi:hypothetical protein
LFIYSSSHARTGTASSLTKLKANRIPQCNAMDRKQHRCRAHTAKPASRPHEISSKSSWRVPNIDQASRHCLANEVTHQCRLHTHTSK